MRIKTSILALALVTGMASAQELKKPKLIVYQVILADAAAMDALSSRNLYETNRLMGQAQVQRIGVMTGATLAAEWAFTRISHKKPRLAKGLFIANIAAHSVATIWNIRQFKKR